MLVGFASSLIAIRIRRLARAAEQMAAGRFDVPVPPGGGDEIGDLTRSSTRRGRSYARASACSPPSATASAIFDGWTEAVIVAGEDGHRPVHEPRGRPPAAKRQTRPGPDSVVAAGGGAGLGRDPLLPIDGRLYGVQARRVRAEQAVLLVVRDLTEELKREQARPSSSPTRRTSCATRWRRS